MIEPITQRRPIMNKSNFSPIQTKLAGVSFGDCQAAIRKWGYRDIGYFSLEREHDNPYDHNAVGVWFLNDRLGYLQKPVAEKLAQVMDAGRTFSAEFVCRNEYKPFENIGLTVRIVETTIQQ
jgi:HIRAN domain.